MAPGCRGPAWDVAALARRAPALRALEPHRLADITPYALPAQGVVSLFLCRWTTDAPIPVAVSRGFDPEARQALEVALRAWEAAGLGVRFHPVEPGAGWIEIEPVEGPVETVWGPGSGNTVADCRVGKVHPSVEPEDALAAELVWARIRLARETPPDARGRTRTLLPEELAGAALHELGHALGFQGHARRGETAMVTEPQALRRLGSNLLEGLRFADRTLAALYTLPSGAVLGRVEVEPWRTDLMDRMMRLSEANQLEGPFVRVGDAQARIFWRDRAGREYGLSVINWVETRRRPHRVLIVPEARTRRALPRSRDLPR